MKLETKKQIEKGAMLLSPLFTISMFLLPWMGYLKQDNSLVGEMQTLYSFFELLKMNITILTSIILWGSLIGVVVSFVIYILSLILKEKESLLIKIASITLVVANAILILTPLSRDSNEILLNVLDYKWIDFMFIPFALSIIYSVVILIYIYKKDAKKEETK